ncbi:tRNA (guanosine(37)-N1)-methyltransferase TrmD [Patescibacteria group bacterium]|nr:tRNA (guanosine(37)-N1)-methyltransferase TrmD [Patescibacteria group bacterium]MBU1915863.1 tRNA (guanosine(37)-N1)-methyltransferase TrmD [Patescibacteria group bacterium]
MTIQKHKIRFDIISIFPKMFEGYFSDSIIARAQKKRLIDIRLHDLRRWTNDRHRTVDDKPFGGGPGMIMMIEPFYRAVRSLRLLRNKKTSDLKQKKSTNRVILMSAKGKRFTHKDAVRLAKYNRIVLLCGRYEGVDERVARKICDEEISIGDYVLTGGELAAMVVVDAVARHLPGVLGKSESLTQESHTEEGKTEYPQYTRPANFSPTDGKHWRTPSVLLSGDHKKIKAWRDQQTKTEDKN